MFKVNNKDTRATPLASCPLLATGLFNYVWPFFRGHQILKVYAYPQPKDTKQKACNTCKWNYLIPTQRELMNRGKWGWYIAISQMCRMEDLKYYVIIASCYINAKINAKVDTYFGSLWKLDYLHISTIFGTHL